MVSSVTRDNASVTNRLEMSVIPGLLNSYSSGRIRRTWHSESCFFRFWLRVVLIQLPLTNNGRRTLVGEDLSFTLNFLFLSIHHAQQPCSDGHHMYFRGLVVGKVSTSSIEISLTLPLIFTGGSQKMKNLASFSTSLNFSRSRLQMQQDIRTLKQISCVGMIVLYVLTKFVEV